MIKYLLVAIIYCAIGISNKVKDFMGVQFWTIEMYSSTFITFLQSIYRFMKCVCVCGVVFVSSWEENIIKYVCVVVRFKVFETSMKLQCGVKIE